METESLDKSAAFERDLYEGFIDIAQSLEGPAGVDPEAAMRFVRDVAHATSYKNKPTVQPC